MIKNGVFCISTVLYGHTEKVVIDILIYTASSSSLPLFNYYKSLVSIPEICILSRVAYYFVFAAS